MRRHAEIAGGGVAGLASALMLARDGWTVRVHEQAPSIREAGTGLYIKNNSIEILEDLGLFQSLVPSGVRLERSQIVDRSGNMMLDRALAGDARTHVFRRQTLIETLREGAARAGAEIVTGSTAAAADPSGELILADGRRLKAELVIVADGIRSKIRDSLGITSRYRCLPTRVSRYLVPTRQITPDLITREHWSGRYRIGITPCTRDLSYVYQVSPESDRVASALPIDKAFWTSVFPRLEREIEILAELEPTRSSYSIVWCATWHLGRVAILGDAAHGLPPTLGQGVGLTLMNAKALSIMLERSAIAGALPIWESTVRPISDQTQKWALRYDFFTRQWPKCLWFMRNPILWAFRTFPALNRRMRVADRGLGTTTLGAPSNQSRVVGRH